MIDPVVSIRYMLAGYIAIAFVLVGYVASLALRWRALKRDLEALEEVKKRP
jgi:hypothetical protein